MCPGGQGDERAGLPSRAVLCSGDPELPLQDGAPDATRIAQTQSGHLTHLPDIPDTFTPTSRPAPSRLPSPFPLPPPFPLPAVAVAMSALAANPNNPVVFFDVTIGGQVGVPQHGERPRPGRDCGDNWGCRSVVEIRGHGGCRGFVVGLAGPQLKALGGAVPGDGWRGCGVTGPVGKGSQGSEAGLRQEGPAGVGVNEETGFVGVPGVERQVCVCEGTLGRLTWPPSPQEVGRMKIELFADVVPKTAENFR